MNEVNIVLSIILILTLVVNIIFGLNSYVVNNRNKEVYKEIKERDKLRKAFDDKIAREKELHHAQLVLLHSKIELLKSFLR